MSFIPAAAMTSASPIVAQHTPIAPASICRCAIAAVLCVFAWGLIFVLAFAQKLLIRSIFRIKASMSTNRAGVGICSTGSPIRYWKLTYESSHVCAANPTGGNGASNRTLRKPECRLPAELESWLSTPAGTMHLIECLDVNQLNIIDRFSQKDRGHAFEPFQRICHV